MNCSEFGGSDLNEVNNVDGDVCEDMKRNQQRSTVSDNDSGCSLDEYCWTPPGLTASQVHQFMRSIPEGINPYINCPTDRFELKYSKQTPPQDSEMTHSRDLSDEEKKELSLFCEIRTKESLGEGRVQVLDLDGYSCCCFQCGEAIISGSLVVSAARVGTNVFWHPACFTCHQCKELLKKLVYFYCAADKQIYCGRHHAELFKPRCAVCDEIIFSDECTQAEGRSWHMKHFTCSVCEMPLGGKRYVMNDGRPCCCTCFESVHAKVCGTCLQTIGIGTGHMTYNGLYWHASNECFRCESCAQSLVGQPFLPKNGAVYCSGCTISIPERKCVTQQEERNCRQIQNFEKSAQSINRVGNEKVISSPAKRLTLNEFPVEDQYYQDNFEEHGSLIVYDVDEPCPRNVSNDNVVMLRRQGASAGNISIRRANPSTILSREEIRELTDENFRESRRRDYLSLQRRSDRGCSAVELRFDREEMDNTFPDRHHRRHLHDSNTMERSFLEHSRQNSPRLSKQRMPHKKIWMVDGAAESEVEDREEINRSRRSVRDENQDWQDLSERPGTRNRSGVFQEQDCNAVGASSALEENEIGEMSTTLKSCTQSRKSKNLSVRFDPSTKPALSPSPAEEFSRRHRHKYRSMYSHDDTDFSQFYDRSRRRSSGYSSDSGIRSRSYNSYSHHDNRRANKRRQPPENYNYNWEHEYIDRERAGIGSSGRFAEYDPDDWEKCSTCSSSSDSWSSEYYSRYGGDLFTEDDLEHSVNTKQSHSRGLPATSAPMPRYRTLPASSQSSTQLSSQLVGKKKKKHKKNCVVS